jgi:hypothetical protein
MGRLSTPDNEPDLLRFYDAIQVSRLETALTVKADIPMDVLERFIARIDRLRPVDRVVGAVPPETRLSLPTPRRNETPPH